MSEELYEKAAESILNADAEAAEEIAKESLDKGIDPLDMIENGFTEGISEVGRLFDRGDMFLPEVMSCADAMKAATSILNEAKSETEGKSTENIKFVLGTVEGDVHDIGKGIVASILEANGIEVYDLGTDVPTPEFIEKAKEVDADIIGTSALLTTTMEASEDLIELLEEENLRDRFKVVVGGGPVTERWANKIDADGYAENANQAVVQAKKLAEK